MAEICFENAGKYFNGAPVLQGFNACIASGEKVAVTGPSGAGKTTLVRVLLGLEQLDEGSLRGAQGLQFACAFQEDRLCNEFSAVQNVALVMPRGSEGKIKEALGSVGLGAADIHKPAGQLSGGQRGRVALVRALLAPAHVVVLDEAFKGLDEATRQQAYCFVRQYIGARTMVVVTHSTEEAALLCRRSIQVSKYG